MGTNITRVKRRSAGFTLTELLVAMAIFLILGAALSTLFTSAVHSVRQGYASIAAFEQGRMAMTTISRDLNGAFTSREFGDLYNFYGRHDAFMFVGALEDGKLGRVTYAFHPERKNPPFRTTLREPWLTIRQAVHRQASRLFREQGLSGTAVANQANAVVNSLVVAYGLGTVASDVPDDAIVELNVELQLESLIRLEEALTDLNTFNMTVATGIALPWPYIDPVDPTEDQLSASPEGAAQLEFVVSALNPIPGNNATDLRSKFVDINTTGGWAHPVTGDQLYLRVLGRDTFQQIINARKREFWVRWLSGDIYDAEFRAITPYWYDEDSGVPNTDRKIVNEYVVADGVIARASVFNPAFSAPIPVGFGVNEPIDALDADLRFTYGNGEHVPLPYFNDFQNLRDPDDPDAADPRMRSVPMLVNSGAAIDNADLIIADNRLADNLLGDRSSRRNLGSPLAPRIPAVVTPQIWITRSKRDPNAADVRRLFIQAIHVPSAQGRSSSTAIAQGPGGAL